MGDSGTVDSGTVDSGTEGGSGTVDDGMGQVGAASGVPEPAKGPKQRTHKFVYPPGTVPGPDGRPMPQFSSPRGRPGPKRPEPVFASPNTQWNPAALRLHAHPSPNTPSPQRRPIP